MKKTVYTAEGIECKFKHGIDYRQALDSGLYFEKNPIEEAVDDIEKEKEKIAAEAVNKEDEAAIVLKEEKAKAKKEAMKKRRKETAEKKAKEKEAASSKEAEAVNVEEVDQDV